MSGGYLVASDVIQQLRSRSTLPFPRHRLARRLLLPIQREQWIEDQDGTAQQLIHEIPTLDVTGSPAAAEIKMAQLAQDVAQCPADPLFGLLARAGRGRALHHAARNQDLIVGEIAIRRDLCVLTDDPDFARALRQCAGASLTLAEFSAH